jgi:hypothetical protein
VKKILKKSDEEDLNFLDETTTPDVENQLRFDILKDVYLTKKEKAAALKTAADTKAYNERILSIIADKKEQKLLDLPIEELEKLIK